MTSFYEERPVIRGAVEQESELLQKTKIFLAAEWPNNIFSNCEMDYKNIPFSCQFLELNVHVHPR